MLVGSDRYKSRPEGDQLVDGKTGSDLCSDRRTDISSEIIDIL